MTRQSAAEGMEVKKFRRSEGEEMRGWKRERVRGYEGKIKNCNA